MAKALGVFLLPIILSVLSLPARAASVEEFYKGNPYPSGEERRRLNEAWDGFMSLVAELVPDRAVSPPVNGKEYKDGFDPG